MFGCRCAVEFGFIAFGTTKCQTPTICFPLHRTYIVHILSNINWTLPLACEPRTNYPLTINYFNISFCIPYSSCGASPSTAVPRWVFSLVEIKKQGVQYLLNLDVFSTSIRLSIAYSCHQITLMVEGYHSLLSMYYYIISAYAPKILLCILHYAFCIINDSCRTRTVHHSLERAIYLPFIRRSQISKKTFASY